MIKTFKQLPKNHEFKKVKLEVITTDEGFTYYVYPSKYDVLPKDVNVFELRINDPVKPDEVFAEVLSVLLGNDSKFGKALKLIQIASEVGLFKRLLNAFKRLFK